MIRGVRSARSRQIRGWPARLAMEWAWLLQSDPSLMHRKCHRSNVTWDKQKQASSCRNPFPDQDTDSQHSRASWVCGKDLSMAVWWPSPDLPLLRPLNHINRGSCLTLSIHTLLSSSRSPPWGGGCCRLFPEVCLLHLQPRTSVSGWLISKKLHCPHEGNNSSPFPPASSPSLQHVLLPHPLGLFFSFLSSHLLFITGPLPSTSEWCGLWKEYKALVWGWALEAFHDRPKAILLASP